MFHRQVLSTLWLTIIIASVNAANPNCGFGRKLLPGDQQYVTSPGFPQSYRGSRNCLWHFTSDTRVKLTCNYFNLPRSRGCDQDYLEILSGGRSGKYCGNGNFSKESSGQEMRITFYTTPNTPGGAFSCIAEAVEDRGCRCGWKKPTKIVGGDETGVNEFPMMAGIIVATHRHIRCGATIISNHHVLTAAHCMRGLNDTSQMGVLVGEHDVTIGWETNATQLFKVFRYDPHPSYDPNKQDFDIGIITINGFIAFTNEVGPACLPFQHYLDSFGGSVVYMLGWGTDEYAGSQSNALRKVEVSVTNFLTCKQVFPGLTYRQICTLSEGMDACQYDSGGPVLWQNPTTRRLVLVGIISYGSGCASSAPAVNTRVGSFIEWIVRTTGAQFCQAE